MFAEAITVARIEPSAANLTDAVELAPFTAEQAAGIVPVGPQDPAWDLLSGVDHNRYGAAPEQLVADFAHGPNAVTWGVHVQDRLVGLAAIRKTFESRVELFVAREYRGRGIGALTLAGVVRAAVAPDYLPAHNRQAWGYTPYILAAELQTANTAAQRLAQGFGFQYYTHRGATGDSSQRVNTYHLSNGVAPGSGDARGLRSVRQAIGRLRQFTVTAHGKQHIPDSPYHILETGGPRRA